MNRKLLIFVLALACCGCVLSGCSSAKSEKEIVTDLQASASFAAETVKIYNYTIIKRQTDKNAKTDFVYVNVDAKNDQVLCNRSYKMTYALYNSGWLLEEVEPFEKETWTAKPLCGVSDETIQEYIAQNINENGYTSLEIVGRTTDLENGGFDTIRFQAKKAHLYANEKVEFTQTWYFNPQTYYFNELAPEDVKHIFSPTNDLVGAEWKGLTRDNRKFYVLTMTDTFDFKVIGLNEECIQIEVIQNDNGSKWWSGLDFVPQTKTTISVNYLGYSKDCGGMIGIPLDALSKCFYSYGDEDDFDEQDYLFFDLDSSYGKIVRFRGEADDAVELRQISNGRTSKEMAIEDAIRCAKEWGTKSYYDENAPMCGVWIVTNDIDGGVGVLCRAANGKGKTYLIDSRTYGEIDLDSWTLEGDTYTFKSRFTNSDGVSAELFWLSADAYEARYYDNGSNTPHSIEYGTRVYFDQFNNYW